MDFIGPPNVPHLDKSDGSISPPFKVPSQEWRIARRDGVNHAIEIWKYKSSSPRVPKAKLTIDRFRDHELPAYISEGPSRSNIIENVPPTSGLRLIAGRCLYGPDARTFNILPFSQATTNNIANSWIIPREFYNLILEKSARYSRKTFFDGKNSASHITFTFKTCAHFGGSVTYALTYQIQTGVSSAVLLSQSSMNFDGIFLLLGTAKELASHPMLLPLVVGELLLKLYSEKVDSADGRLEKGEEVTGMHTFAHRPKGNPLSIGIETTRSLNSSSTTLGVLEMRLNGLLHLFETIAQYSTFLSTIIPQERKETYLRDDFVLREKMDNHLSLCKSLLQRVVYNQRRATTQLAVAYNFAQQKDNMTNLEVAADSRSIAQASKHDSSAMRSIAVLTMVFLPGTAVATIFSMPFFQVQNGQGQSGLVANQFWIYWAVTVPLTFVVLLVWIIWIRWSQYLHAQQDAAARSGKENNPEELNPRALVATFVSLKWLLPIKTKTSSESIETAA